MNLSKLWEDRGGWHAVDHGVQRVRHDLATEQQLSHIPSKVFFFLYFSAIKEQNCAIFRDVNRPRGCHQSEISQKEKNNMV